MVNIRIYSIFIIIHNLIDIIKYNLLKVFSAELIDNSRVTLKGDAEVLIMSVSSKKL